MASASAPKLRNLGQTSWAYCLGFSLTVSSLFAIWYKKNVLEARKRHYAEFYENYDSEKEFEAIRAAGLFKGFEDPR